MSTEKRNLKSADNGQKKSGLSFSRKKIVLFVALILFVAALVLIIVEYFMISAKMNQVFTGNPIDAITKNEPLKSVNGRTNFLIFGTSQDDPNPNHTAGYLTDSIIVMSVDQVSRKAYTLSIPRDLWVDYDATCSLGKSGKINAFYVCTQGTYGKNSTQAGEVFASKVGTITGLDIQYYISVNYTFVESLTNALGGNIEVDVYSDDPRGIYDSATGLKLPAGINNLDGKLALKLARARNSQGGYGLRRSNFDREINQQRIISALFSKISQENILKNPALALDIIDSFSGNVSTNIPASEVRSAINIARDIDPKKVTSISLVNHFTTGSISNQSVVLPIAGQNNYSKIQDYLRKELKSGESE